ncbi:hypothetical protein FOZ63_016346, partial [Perkinsus olseni]
ESDPAEDPSNDLYDQPQGSPLPDEEIHYAFAVSRDQQSITCYRCLQDGHPARDCTQEIGKKDDRCSRCGNPTHTIDKCNVSVTASCHRCGRQGHLAYVCPDPLPTASPSSNRAKGSKGKGKGPAKGKGKSTSTASAQATTSSTAPDLSSAQSAAPATPNVKISGVDPSENNDAPSDSSDDDIANSGQSNTIRVHQLTTTSTTTTEEAQDQVKLRPIKPKNHVVDHQRQDCPTVRSTPMSCSSSTTSTRCDIVVGVIKIGPETRP